MQWGRMVHMGARTLGAVEESVQMVLSIGELCGADGAGVIKVPEVQMVQVQWSRVVVWGRWC